MSKDQNKGFTEHHSKTGRLAKKYYFHELESLQVKLVKLHEWVRAKGLRGGGVI